MRSFTTLLLLATLSIGGCRPSCKETTETYPDGGVRIRVIHCEDSLHSSYQSFYPDGQIKQVKKLVDGHTDGLVTTYDSIGRISWKAYYRRDTLHGPYEDFFGNGHVRTRSAFSNGLQDGKYISFYENGKTKSTANFQQGKQIGEFLEYHPNGVLLMRALYEMGVPIEYVEYDSLGNEVGAKRAADVDPASAAVAGSDL